MQDQLKKWVWTSADFDSTGWHDVTIHAIANIPEKLELVFDLDYLCEWVCPVPPSQVLNFHVAPATLVFSNVSALKIDLELTYFLEITIGGIERSDPRPQHNSNGTDWLWKIDSSEQGEISFRADDYQLFIRRAPQLTGSQSLSMAERGGLSFERDFQG